MVRRVLIVDDESAMRRIVKLQLSRAGFTVETASDGGEALEIAAEFAPDLIVTDLQMPGMDGSELCRRLAEVEAGQGVPVIMLTARGFELDSGEFENRPNVVGMLSKPFAPTELLKLVEDTLARN